MKNKILIIKCLCVCKRCLTNPNEQQLNQDEKPSHSETYLSTICSDNCCLIFINCDQHPLTPCGAQQVIEKSASKR